MAFRFGMPNVAFRKRMSWFDFTVACVVGVIAGIYTFKPGLQQAKEAIERREALKEIQARRKAEAEKGILNKNFVFFTLPSLLFRIEIAINKIRFTFFNPVFVF
jgi:hypothetical protein